jgi:hypothetical protein
MFWVLTLKSVSIAGFHGHEIAALKLSERTNAAVKDIKTQSFFPCFVRRHLY